MTLSFQKPVDGWYKPEIGYEDLINVMAMRVLMKMAAEKSVNEQQVKKKEMIIFEMVFFS